MMFSRHARQLVRLFAVLMAVITGATSAHGQMFDELFTGRGIVRVPDALGAQI